MKVLAFVLSLVAAPALAADPTVEQLLTANDVCANLAVRMSCALVKGLPGQMFIDGTCTGLPRTYRKEHAWCLNVDAQMKSRAVEIESAQNAAAAAATSSAAAALQTKIDAAKLLFSK